MLMVPSDCSVIQLPSLLLRETTVPTNHLKYLGLDGILKSRKLVIPVKLFFLSQQLLTLLDPALAVFGDGATSYGDTVQGTSWEMGSWNGGTVSLETRFFKKNSPYFPSIQHSKC